MPSISCASTERISVGRSVIERKELLQKLLKNPPGVIRYSAALGEDAEQLMEQVRAIGLEGLIGKRKNSVYEPGRRSGAWIKLKLQRQQEFVIGGYTPPSGTRKYFGALLVGSLSGEETSIRGKGWHRFRCGAAPGASRDV